MVTDPYKRKDIILKPNGEKITRQSIVNEGETFYEEAYQEKLTDVCDFSEGSEIRTLHESFAVELFSLYKEMYRMAKMKYVLDSENTYLDRLGCEYHLKRKQERCATGTVTFSTDETLLADYTIPQNTILLSRYTGYEYVLDENVVITNSSTPVTGTIHSKLAGSKYNVGQNNITAFQNIGAIRRNIKVTNNSPITGGDDAESDESFRQRILNAKREKSWGTATVYNNFLKGAIAGLHDIQFVSPDVLMTSTSYPEHYKEDVTEADLLNKNGTKKSLDDRKEYYCTECSKVLFVNGYQKPCGEDLLKEVEYAITQQNNLVIGHLFHVQEAKVNSVYLGMELFTSSVVSESTVYEHLTTYFNGGTIETKRGTTEYSGVDINDSIYKNRLLNVLESIPGVEQVSHLHQLRYNSGLNVDDYNWIDNGDNSYTFTDSDGFIFYREDVDESSINHWGWRNFTILPCPYGCVLKCGDKREVDKVSEDIFDYKYVLTDD